MNSFKEFYEVIEQDTSSRNEFTSNAVKKDKRIFKLYNSNIKTLYTYYKYLNDLVSEPNEDHHQKIQILRDLNLYSDEKDNNITARQSIVLKLYSSEIQDKDYILSLMMFFLAIDSSYPVIKGSEFIMDVLPQRFFENYDYFLESIIEGETKITNPIFGAYVFYSNKELLYSYMDFMILDDNNETEWLVNLQENKKSMVYKRIHDCQKGSFKNEALLASYYYTMNSILWDEITGYENIIALLIGTFKKKVKILAKDNAPLDADWDIFQDILLNLNDNEKKAFLKSIGNTESNISIFKKNKRRRNSITEMLGREREVTAKQRVNQGKFRAALLEDERHEGCRICQCNINNEKYLRASHIVSWKESNPKEKLDKDNGLLLCPMHDLLFDSHLISFEDNGTIIISDNIELSDYEALNISINHKINADYGNIKYLEKHRKQFELKNQK